MKKLLFEQKEVRKKQAGDCVRVGDAANAILKMVSDRTGLSRSKVASRMITFAAQYIEFTDGFDMDDDDADE